MRPVTRRCGHGMRAPGNATPPSGGLFNCRARVGAPRASVSSRGPSCQCPSQHQRSVGRPTTEMRRARAFERSCSRRTNCLVKEAIFLPRETGAHTRRNVAQQATVSWEDASWRTYNVRCGGAAVARAVGACVVSAGRQRPPVASGGEQSRQAAAEARPAAAAAGCAARPTSALVFTRVGGPARRVIPLA